MNKISIFSGALWLQFHLCVHPLSKSLISFLFFVMTWDMVI